MLDFITFMFIVSSIFVIVYRWYTTYSRCKEVGQELTWNTFWNKPELYEMITSPDREHRTHIQLLVGNEDF